MDNTTNTPPVTLESIAQKKAMLLQEIRLQKEIMTGLTQEIFAPLEPATNKANAMMRYSLSTFIRTSQATSLLLQAQSSLLGLQLAAGLFRPLVRKLHSSHYQ